MARRLPVAHYAPGSKVPHLWSVERETHHTYRDPAEFIDEAKIFKALEATKEHAKDAGRVRDILAKAKQNAFVGHGPNVPDKESEFVQGLNLEECATLLNVDSDNVTLMNDIFDTALAIKNRIYGNRVVLFAPLYIANHCVNSCTYCAFRSANKGMERSILTDDDLREEVAALQLQGHRRILALTGESPTYTFEQFLHAVDVMASVKTEPFGSIRRINVEIPPLSVSDMRRLKATDNVGTFVLFQESYHRDTFKTMHPTGPKSDFDYRVLTQDRAMRAGLDDVGIGALFGLFDYRYEVPYTGMILSTRESPEMRSDLLKCGMSQISAGSRTDVGAYHKDHTLSTEANLGKLAGQPTGDIVKWLLEDGYVPSWCTACYRQGRTGEDFMNICKAGDIHNFCHPNSLLTRQEYLSDYADPDLRAKGEAVIAQEMGEHASEPLSAQALKRLERKMKLVKEGQHDVYI
ncbi:2-iminoacetate synthase [Tetrabaena socialis]|uniref:2-iminoacetate synthase n=1 Tax=Tetrabaena socialis TaxID=47790 RepID=A0A2J8AE72_9CHLO|nr:2-iminoacetate synthase [Tetrabaena socialis]|eukprot:PNH10796.1 2-iminoacetate synthase [Tetrabaena socialis]